MPHSSGGGSHSGGLHFGSSSSRGSSHSFKMEYFTGADRYLYYENKTPKFFYADYDITEKRNYEGAAIFIGLLLFIWIMLFFTFLHNPHKLRQNYNTRAVILDYAKVINNKDTVYEAFDSFLDKTGITPALVTVTKSRWEEYSSLEDYAYDTYVRLFKDEKHWLIVYSTGDIGEDGFEDWKWEGMQGDKTDSILNYREKEIFNNALQSALSQRNIYDVGEAVAFAFDTLTPVIMDLYLGSIEKGVLISFACFFIIWIIFSLDINPKRDKMMSNAQKCPDTFTVQKKCEQCDGIYIAGMHDACPHCGAEIPKQFSDSIADSINVE